MSQISLNSTRFSRSSAKIKIAGYTGICGVPKWNETIGGDLMYMGGPIAVGMVIGEVKSEIEIPILPESLDGIKQNVGVGYAEVALPVLCTLYEPGNSSGIFVISNDACWIKGDSFEAPAEGAVSTLKLIGQFLTNWNGVTALDLAARNISPGSIGGLFSAIGFAL